MTNEKEIAYLLANMESHIEKYIVEPGHAAPGELVAYMSGLTVKLKSTSDRTVDEILKLAFPNEYAKSIEKQPDYEPMNRAERRSMKRRRL